MEDYNDSMPPGEVTALLAQVKRGDKEAYGRLMPLVYGELRRLAGHYMRGESPGHTLQPTAVVHEAYLRLVGLDRLDWQNRAQFMGVAAQMMRRILVDHARQRVAAKRVGSGGRADVDVLHMARVENPEETLAVDMAVERLRELDPRQSQVVEMRYFGGLSVEETSEALGISTRTVKRHWALAKAWLHAELSGRSLP
jgi:RNA polymerase sigma-70 factor (ECF subfamily)